MIWNARNSQACVQCSSARLQRLSDTGLVLCLRTSITLNSDLPTAPQNIRSTCCRQIKHLPPALQDHDMLLL